MPAGLVAIKDNMSFVGLGVLALLPTVLAGAAPLVGIMYEGWHAPAVQAIEDCTAARRFTVEAVLRSNSTQSHRRIRHGGRECGAGLSLPQGAATGILLHISQARHGCAWCHGPARLPQYPGTAARHAAMLSAANISFVVADSQHPERLYSATQPASPIRGAG